MEQAWKTRRINFPFESEICMQKNFVFLPEKKSFLLSSQ